jgi:hypothetical protein
MRRLAKNMLVVLPQLSPYESRSAYLSKAYENLVGFFRNRFGIESHVISSAESCLAVPELEGVKMVQAIHPVDVDFFTHHIMLLETQDILYKDAFDAAASKVPLKRGLSINERMDAVAGREEAAVKHIARKHYDMIVDFEHPRSAVYHLSPSLANIYLRVSTLNQTVEAFFKGKSFDLSTLLQYDGTNKPLGYWDEGGQAYVAS